MASARYQSAYQACKNSSIKLCYQANCKASTGFNRLLRPVKPATRIDKLCNCNHLKNVMFCKIEREEIFIKMLKSKPIFLKRQHTYIFIDNIVVIPITINNGVYN